MDSPDRSGNLRRNIEVKIRLDSIAEARRMAEQVATEHLGLQVQVDTYFRCRSGRLKLRLINDESAQLIWYARSDRAQARQSQYYLLDVSEPALARQLLTAAMGITQIVEKRREIFLYQNVRIHLDEVVDLGSFLEFEAVLSASQDPAAGHAQLEWLCRQFAITPDQFLSQSYGDM